MATEQQGRIEEWKTIGLGEGDVHRLLAAERRQLALDVLGEGGPTDLEDLAEAVVRLEGPGEVTGRAVERAAVDLYHSHLPLMADVGVVEFDRRSGRVEARRGGGT